MKKGKSSNLIKTMNQVHPPKNNGVDALGNPRKVLRVRSKDKSSTMAFIKNITPNQAECLEGLIRGFLDKTGLKLECDFIRTM